LKSKKKARPKVREKSVPTIERTTPATSRVMRPTAKNVSSVLIMVLS
jgi:hypothetical protein